MESESAVSEQPLHKRDQFGPHSHSHRDKGHCVPVEHDKDAVLTRTNILCEYGAESPWVARPVLNKYIRGAQKQANSQITSGDLTICLVTD